MMVYNTLACMMRIRHKGKQVSEMFGGRKMDVVRCAVYGKRGKIMRRIEHEEWGRGEKCLTA